MAHTFSSPFEPASAEDAADLDAAYDALVRHLRRLGVGETAPTMGAPFPRLSLPDLRGVFQTIEVSPAAGPLVVSFIRGAWCPYCLDELDSWREVLPSLHEAGGRLVIVTAEIGDNAPALRVLEELGALVVCDVDHGAALACGLAFYIGAEIERRYQDIGLDLEKLNGSTSGFLPAPATFVLESDGIVRYAFVDVDFRLRAYPPDVVEIVSRL